MDPITLLATANAAVAAVKKGCQLYKDIKNAGGEVSDVLKDLKAQFSKFTNPTPEQKKQYVEEVQRIQAIGKADPNDVFSEIGEQLGVLMDVMDSLGKALLEEERSGKSVYKGNESPGRRALKRIIIRERMNLIFTEIRETMVFKSPKELGALWSKYSEMIDKITAEQEAAHKEELRQLQITRWRRRKAVEEVRAKAAWISAVIFILFWATGIMWLTMKSTILYRGLYS